MKQGSKPKGRHQEKRLTVQAIRALKEPGMYGDGNGLYLKVDANGSKRWVQRLVIQGKRRDIGLGSASLKTLSEAREQALEGRKLARSGGDPIAARKRSEGIPKLKRACEAFQELSKPNWRNEKHAKQWLQTLKTYVFPKLGERSIDTVTGSDILSVLMPIWNERPETARRVKQRLGSVLSYAIAQGWRTDNPADAVGPVLPKHDRSKIQHHKALPYEKVGEALATVRNSNAGASTKLALEFLVLTATRSREAREARWCEIDLDGRLWIIPRERMKAKKEHRIPLSDRCLAILKEAASLRPAEEDRSGKDLVFPATTITKPLSDNTLSKLMRELGIPAVPHGFRSSFRDWAGEQTNHPREVIEHALAHMLKDKAEAAYARSDLLAKRKKVMDDWAGYLTEKRQ
jgi:integrase